jgi:hypothetical protein
VGSNPAGGAYIWGYIQSEPPHIAIIGEVTKPFSAILAPLWSSQDGHWQINDKFPGHTLSHNG